MTQPSAPVQQLDQRLIASRLVHEQQLRECLAAVGTDGKATNDQLAGELFRRGWVTRWQLEQLARGQTAFFVDQNRYVLLSLIGQGGMGAVYKARHVRMGRDVALKVIDPKRVTDQSLVQRFKREVEVCSKLQHEHIVQAFDVGEYAGATFLVLEFVEGSDLAALVKRDGPMQPDEAAAICLQAAAGLAYAHVEGIVHRDIKPQNILLSTSGIVKILDMGLARVLDESGDDPHTSLTQEGAVMGTVDYMAPEQARDTKSADARSDIYSLGGTLFYLLAGRPTFARGSVIERLSRLASDAPPRLSEIRIDCPHELDEIVQKMLAKRPEDRFQTAGDVVRALRPLAAERISGRAAVTAAVLSAADTIHAARVVPTDAEVFFSQMDESLVTTVRQRQAPKASFNQKQKMKLGAIVGTLIFTVALVGWRMTGPAKQSSPQTDVNRVTFQPPESRAPAKSPGEIRRELPGHYSTIRCLAWSPDGRSLASGGFDGDVRIRDPNFKKTSLVYRGHNSAVYGLAWSSNGKLIASGDAFGEVHIWDALTGDQLDKIQRRFDYVAVGSFLTGAGFGGLAFSPDNKRLAYTDAETVVCYDIQERKSIWKRPAVGIRVCFSPSGGLIGSVDFVDGPNVWDAKTGEKLFDLPKSAFPESEQLKVFGFLRDDTLAVAQNDKIQIWECRTKELRKELSIPQPLDAWNTNSPLLLFAPNEDRCRLLQRKDAVDIGLPDGKETRRPLNINPLALENARASHYARFWDASFSAERLAIDGYVDDLRKGLGYVPFADIDRVLAVDFSRISLVGERFLCMGSIPPFDIQTGEPAPDIPQIARLTDDRISLRYLDGGWIAAQPLPGKEGAEKRPPVQLEGLNEQPEAWTDIQLTQDGRMAFGARGDYSALRLWNAQTGAICSTIEFGHDAHDQIKVNADGTVIIKALSASQIQIWRPPFDKSAATFPSDVTQHLRMSLSPDGRQMLTYDASYAGPMRIRSTDEGSRRSLPTHLDAPDRTFDPRVIQFSESGNYLLITRQIWNLETSPPQLVWNAEPDRAVGPMGNAPIHRWGALFSDERHVVIAQDGQFQIWDWRENKKLATHFLVVDGWAWVNHLTHHWSGSRGAEKYLRTDFDRGDGRPPVDVSIREYEQATGWKNDPSQAGLDLEKRNRELAEKAKAD